MMSMNVLLLTSDNICYLLLIIKAIRGTVLESLLADKLCKL